MKKLKVGQWATIKDSGQTFLVVKIGDYPVPGTLESEEGYFDLGYEGHITYHCRKATQEEIENACRELLGEIQPGYVKITGADAASGFERIVKESDLHKVAKEIYAKHPGEEGYYGFTKFLWVTFPDERPECRLDNIVWYD